MGSFEDGPSWRSSDFGFSSSESSDSVDQQAQSTRNKRKVDKRKDHMSASAKRLCELADENRERLIESTEQMRRASDEIKALNGVIQSQQRYIERLQKNLKGILALRIVRVKFNQKADDGARLAGQALAEHKLLDCAESLSD